MAPPLKNYRPDVIGVSASRVIDCPRCGGMMFIRVFGTVEVGDCYACEDYREWRGGQACTFDPVRGLWRIASPA